jgi:hypothetical protein
MKWIDVDSSKVSEALIGDLFKMYSHKMEERDDGYYIDFRNFNVKVQDHTGWTQVLSMRITVDTSGWSEVSVGDSSVIVSDSTLIPVYDLSRHSSGFHGEVKYPFVVKKLSDVHQDDKVKIRTISGSTLYIPIECKPNRNIYPVSGYLLEVKSRMFSILGLQLWGDYTIPEDYCAACPVNGTQNCSGCRKGK